MTKNIYSGTDDFNDDYRHGTITTRLQEAANRIRKLYGFSLVEIGREFLAIEEQLQPDAFERWVEVECGMPIGRARYTMNAARVIAENGSPNTTQGGIAEGMVDGHRSTITQIKNRIAEATRITEKARQTERQRRMRAKPEARAVRHSRAPDRAEAEQHRVDMDAAHAIVRALNKDLASLAGLFYKADPVTVMALVRKAGHRMREEAHAPSPSAGTEPSFPFLT